MASRPPPAPIGGIENARHRQFDASFREDAAFNRKDHDPASMRRRATYLAQRDTSKGSLLNKLCTQVGEMRFFSAFSVSCATTPAISN